MAIVFVARAAAAVHTCMYACIHIPISGKNTLKSPVKLDAWTKMYTTMLKPHIFAMMNKRERRRKRSEGGRVYIHSIKKMLYAFCQINIILLHCIILE